MLNDTVKPAIAIEAECLADWYKMAQTIYLQTQILEKDLSSYEETLFELKDRLIRIKEEMKFESNESKKNISCGFKEQPSMTMLKKRIELSSDVKVILKRINLIKV